MGTELVFIMALASAFTEVLKRFIPYALLPETNPWFDQDRAKLVLSGVGFVAAIFALDAFGRPPVDDGLALLVAFLAASGFYRVVRSEVPVVRELKNRVPNPLNNRINDRNPPF